MRGWIPAIRMERDRREVRVQERMMPVENLIRQRAVRPLERMNSPLEHRPLEHREVRLRGL
jgi:hypothetical protein